MAPYKPPTKVTSKSFTILSLVTQFDPDWARGKFWDVEYDTSSGKVFFGNPLTRGPYNDHSNVYPVGQPFGGDDAARLAAKAPTVGNPVPGLYQGTPDGKGWG